jgi:hypothetical protein
MELFCLCLLSLCECQRKLNNNSLADYCRWQAQNMSKVPFCNISRNRLGNNQLSAHILSKSSIKQSHLNFG